MNTFTALNKKNKRSKSVRVSEERAAARWDGRWHHSLSDVTVMVSDKQKFRIAALVGIGVLFHLLGRVTKPSRGEDCAGSTWWRCRRVEVSVGRARRSGEVEPWCGGRLVVVLCWCNSHGITCAAPFPVSGSVGLAPSRDSVRLWNCVFCCVALWVGVWCAVHTP